LMVALLSVSTSPSSYNVMGALHSSEKRLERLEHTTSRLQTVLRHLQQDYQPEDDSDAVLADSDVLASSFDPDQNVVAQVLEAKSPVIARCAVRKDQKSCTHGSRIANVITGNSECAWIRYGHTAGGGYEHCGVYHGPFFGVFPNDPNVDSTGRKCMSTCAAVLYYEGMCREHLGSELFFKGSKCGYEFVGLDGRAYRVETPYQ